MNSYTLSLINAFKENWLLFFGILFISVVVSFIIYSFVRKLEKSPAFATLIYASATLILVTFAATELASIKRQTECDFLLKMKNHFFTDKNREIIKYIEEIQLQEINAKEAPLMKATNWDKGRFTDYEIDEYILNFDHMSIFIRKNVVDIDDVDRIYGWYITRAWLNSEIRNYVKSLREPPGDPRVYEDFKNLAVRLIGKESERKNSKNIAD